jgi:hypothetical protein
MLITALDLSPRNLYDEAMDVHLNNPDLQAKIDRWVSETGRPANELVEDAMAGYFNELTQVREMLDSRYDDIATGRVKLIDGEEVRREMKAKTQAQRDRRR